MAASKLIEEIIHTGNTRVAEYSISPFSPGRKHRHTQVFEELICLSGSLRMAIDDRDDCRLKAGDRIHIPPGTAHCVFNDSESEARFLVIQGGGRFDLEKA